MKKKTLLIAAIILLIINSCNNSSVTPPEDKPGRRDYVWTVDTVQIFSNYIHSIWGSSPSDLWGVGPGGALNTTIWHYDGKEWTTDRISRPIAPWCVYGFSKNDVWIAGQNGKIWHYDGNSWTQNYQHTINGFIGIDLYDLYGNNNHDLYAVGTVWLDNDKRRGIILHYDGSKWTQEYLADSNSYFAKVRVSYDKQCFIRCIKWTSHSSGDTTYINSGETTVFYKFDGKELIQIYTDEYKSIKQGWISIIDGIPYFSLSNVIYTYQKSQFKELCITNSQYYTPTIFGKTENDIFLGTSDGIAHYNGTDIKLLLPTEEWPNDGLMFDKEVIFLNTTLRNGMSLVYYGKLK